jgi:hypothetical protein
MLFPMIQTLVYHSVAEDEDGVRRWLFQEPPSVSEAGGGIVPSPSAEFIGFSDQQLSWILDFPGLGRALTEVAADHPIHPFEPGRTAESKTSALADLETEVGRFLGNPEYPYPAITVLFTGYGLSLTRFRGGALHAEFCLDSRRSPSTNPRFGIGLPPRESRLRKTISRTGAERAA